MLCLFMKSLEKALEPSILAAAADGPKHGIPTIYIIFNKYIYNIKI